MAFFQPRILHKGLILLFVPLVFEVLVAASLIYLQHYYGESVKAEVLRKQIVFHINEFWYHNINMTTSSLAKMLFEGFQVDWTTSDKAGKEYNTLSTLLANDPRQSKNLTDIKNCHFRIREVCNALTAEQQGASGQLGKIISLRRNLNNCKKLLAGNLEIGELIRSFRQYERQASIEATDKVRFIAMLIQLVLIGAVVGSSLIAFILFGFFMRGIHRGVHALIQNIQRLKSGDSLLPVIEGADELALLDARFHDMAREVAAAQKMKQSFVTTISSEFRSPITSTREFLEQVFEDRQGALSERARERAQKAEQSLQRLLGLMNDLLVLQGPGPSRIEIQPRQCSLTKVIQSAIDSVSAFADQHGVRIESPETQMEAYADPDRIVQVLVNLLSNAIKFSPKGSSVIISTATVDHQVEVKVEDKGRGVPADLREAIFEQFQQVTTTDATEKGGSGLGLPICKEIVELHGGKIGVDSEAGKGSTFWFRLPTGGPLKE